MVPEATTTEIPTDVASSAASSFVVIPPRPLESKVPLAAARMVGVITDTSSNFVASGKRLGSRL